MAFCMNSSSWERVRATMLPENDDVFVCQRRPITADGILVPGCSKLASVLRFRSCGAALR